MPRLFARFANRRDFKTIAAHDAAGLFVRSLHATASMDLGFDPTHVMEVTLRPYALGYSEMRGKEFYRQVLERVRTLPGVNDASLAMSAPLGEADRSADLEIAGYSAAKDRAGVEQAPPSAHWNSVSPDFFATLGMRLLRGRDISAADKEDSPTVAVINQTMAERFWPKQDAMGRRFTIADWKPKRTVEVVGVVNDAHTIDVISGYQPSFFVPLAQNYPLVTALEVRSEGAPEALHASVRRVIKELAPTMPINDLGNLTDGMKGENGVLFPKMAAELAAALGVIGLLLAIVGVYGVISYGVAQRTQEIGVRMALGAQPRQILRMVCRQSLLLVGASVPIGLVAAYGLSRLLGDFLIGIKPSDVGTYAVVTTCLVAVSMVAGYVPARRAARVDPMAALRRE